jgi:hypothetical protein
MFATKMETAGHAELFASPGLIRPGEAISG